MPGTKIDSFTGVWACYSNFHTKTVLLDGVKYRAVEHAYQAAKILDPQKRLVLSLDFNPNLTAGQAKRIGQNLDLRKDWPEVKIPVMRDLLVQKFSDLELRTKLLASGDRELVEGNWWHDEFWGVCMGTDRCKYGPHWPGGENHLGKLLMEIRGNNFR
jgi:ribA/ribD-fused uncharacterized protein